MKAPYQKPEWFSCHVHILPTPPNHQQGLPPMLRQQSACPQPRSEPLRSGMVTLELGSDIPVLCLSRDDWRQQSKQGALLAADLLYGAAALKAVDGQHWSWVFSAKFLDGTSWDYKSTQAGGTSPWLVWACSLNLTKLKTKLIIFYLIYFICLSIFCWICPK